MDFEMKIEVFKTNINDPGHADVVIDSLKQLWPNWKINVDLNDCDNILRIEAGENINTTLVSDHLSGIGYLAELLL